MSIEKKRYEHKRLRDVKGEHEFIIEKCVYLFKYQTISYAKNAHTRSMNPFLDSSERARRLGREPPVLVLMGAAASFLLFAARTRFGRFLPRRLPFFLCADISVSLSESLSAPSGFSSFYRKNE